MKIPVLFPKIFDYPFTYKKGTEFSLNSGDFVKAPFGNTEITGVVWTVVVCYTISHDMLRWL